ncbi:MAG: 30S ribosomal protein S16 [bacterium]
MLKIKLTRVGKKGQPQYRIVVVEARDKNSGKCVELLGTYNPLLKEGSFKLDQVKYQTWLSKGAQPTTTIRKMAAFVAKSK